MQGFKPHRWQFVAMLLAACLWAAAAVPARASSLGAAIARGAEAVAWGAEIMKEGFEKAGRKMARTTSWAARGVKSGDGWNEWDAEVAIFARTGVFAPRLDSLNIYLQAHGFEPFFELMPLQGGGVYFMQDGWKVAGIGDGGQTSTKKGSKYARMSVGLGALHVARSLRLGASSSVEIGGLLGGGGATLHLSDGHPPTFPDAIAHRNDTVMYNTFLLVGPTVSAQFDLWKHVGFRMEAGHLYTYGAWAHAATGKAIRGGPRLSGPYFSFVFEFKWGPSSK